ncbi:N-acetylglucosaminyldiphosphoundecaprenol N-acetyl-beta-D-mannosaminyltransferase [Flavobacterium xinjiangense]|uniref:N-acetylglucosaminyldiphosphoundecaprenol N-acetyl-beta-D-mannosaminyltransferase n=2 Tax=Flavobacterium xinjiangense TaxID=178356 RepID=A0A1M7MRI9_9FLAO|nr:N-acetylglucosaminyldiphosphoundecaprenol N-acetyl-beta-D-mannosaminyltransferase [Flavobacterium xinjiangense]
MPTVYLQDYAVFSGDLKRCFISDKTLINTINQYSYCIAERDAVFKTALQQSDILLPDGIGIVAAVKLLSGQKITKIAGADIHHYLLEELNRKGGSCFYLGSTDNTLKKIVARLSKEFPNVKVCTFSPPYKPEFSDTDNLQMLEAVNVFQPDVLFIGMTAPKQEKWSYQHKTKLDAKIICSIGAVFDFYAGTVDRPSPFWIKLQLEWFIRLCNEPKRMWKRYLYYGPLFVKSIILQKIKSFT